MEEVEDEPLFAERVAGIDIAKAEVMVTIRVPSDARRGRRQQETRPFRAVLKDLLALADWLRAWQVTKVGMEPRRSRRCPGGRRPTSWTRRGWRGSPSAASCPPASCPRRTSAGCAPIPGTGGT
jgi:hypothetical protein